MADMDAPTGRGSQVIKVVMPTYIMAPTEDERFRRKKTCRIIAECLKRELEGKEFDENDAKASSASIADAVKARIHAESSAAARYKVVVQTFVGQQRLQDVRITSRCLWDNDHDNHASAVFNSVRPCEYDGGVTIKYWHNTTDCVYILPLRYTATHLGDVHRLWLLRRLIALCRRARQNDKKVSINKQRSGGQDTYIFRISINYFSWFYGVSLLSIFILVCACASSLSLRSWCLLGVLVGRHTLAGCRHLSASSSSSSGIHILHKITQPKKSNLLGLSSHGP